jgi:hypothetical protein
LNWQWLLNDILKPFKGCSNEKETVGFGHAGQDRAHRFSGTRRFCTF